MTPFKRIASILLLLFITACTIILPSPIVIIRDAQATDTASPSPSPTVTTIPTVTATPSPTAILSLSAVTTANVNFRIAPSTNNTPITVVAAGTRVSLVGRNQAGDWIRTILSDGRQGWMYWQNLDISGNRFDLPVVTIQATATPTIDPTPTREVGKSRISYNINGEAIPDRVYLTGHLQRLCPTTVLCMNCMAYAVELERLLRPCGTLVAHRTYSYYEGDEWVVRSPQAIVNAWIAEGHPEIIRYSVNEPSYGGNHSIQSFVASQVELMRLARAAGFTVIVGNNAVGSWRWEDIAAGYYDPILRALELYGHFLGLHEYTQTVLAFGVSQWPREYLLDRNRVQPADWPTMAQVPVAMQFDPVIRDMNYPRYYHLRRGDWFLLRADEIGISRPRIWLTEFAWDSLADIKPTLEPLRQPFCVMAGTRPKYLCDFRGGNTYTRLWAWYWPNWSFAQAACEQLKWADSIYPPEYIGFNIFTWSVNPMWLHTDVSGRENPAMFELHRCLEAA